MAFFAGLLPEKMQDLFNNQPGCRTSLFRDFDFYQPVIYSIFEHHYTGYIYTDAQSKPNWALLQTPFLQHIIAGEPTENCEEVINNILFSIILGEQMEKEIVTFYKNNEWNTICKKIWEPLKTDCFFRFSCSFSPSGAACMPTKHTFQSGSSLKTSVFRDVHI